MPFPLVVYLLFLFSEEAGEEGLDLALAGHQAERYDNDECGEELHILARQAEVDDHCQNDAVDDRADNDAAKAQKEVLGPGKDGFADDDGGKADDDRADTELDVGQAVVLREDAAREGDEAVGEGKTDDLGGVGVDALGNLLQRKSGGGLL